MGAPQASRRAGGGKASVVVEVGLVAGRCADVGLSGDGGRCPSRSKRQH